MKLPDFLIIGVQKGGTTSLFNYLKQHPEIDLPEQKEIHFFDKHYHKGIDWYKNQFPKTPLITGEASPYYIFHPLVPARVAKCCPDAKIIVLLRNPVDRAYSHFYMKKNRNKEPLASFEEAIAAESGRIGFDKLWVNEPDLNAQGNLQRFSYLSRGKYYSQITRWLKLFPVENFLFLKSENLFNTPQLELSRIFEFLNVKHVEIRNLAPMRQNNYPPMTATTRSRLNAFFAPENQKLTSLLGEGFMWPEHQTMKNGK